jgi:hypothetical protein
MKIAVWCAKKCYLPIFIFLHTLNRSGKVVLIDRYNIFHATFVVMRVEKYPVEMIEKEGEGSERRVWSLE